MVHLYSVMCFCHIKVPSWSFDKPRQDFKDLLRSQMEGTFSQSILSQLFSVDFKQHIKAIARLSDVSNLFHLYIVPNLSCMILELLCLFQSLKTDRAATVANTDLILKWLTLRFFDTNTSMLLKALEYIQDVFKALAESSYRLHELEASAFMPFLINKVT